MAAVPTRFAQVILCFAGLFCQRTWRHAQLLLMGAVLVPGARTVTGVLRVLGLAHERHFVNFHRVLILLCHKNDLYFLLRWLQEAKHGLNGTV